MPAHIVIDKAVLGWKYDADYHTTELHVEVVIQNGNVSTFPRFASSARDCEYEMFRSAFLFKSEFVD